LGKKKGNKNFQQGCLAICVTIKRKEKGRWRGSNLKRDYLEVSSWGGHLYKAGNWKLKGLGDGKTPETAAN